MHRNLHTARLMPEQGMDGSSVTADSAQGEEGSGTENKTFRHSRWALKWGDATIREAARAQVTKRDCLEETGDTQPECTFRAY